MSMLFSFIACQIAVLEAVVIPSNIFLLTSNNLTWTNQMAGRELSWGSCSDINCMQNCRLFFIVDTSILEVVFLLCIVTSLSNLQHDYWILILSSLNLILNMQGIEFTAVTQESFRLKISPKRILLEIFEYMKMCLHCIWAVDSFWQLSSNCRLELCKEAA